MLSPKKSISRPLKAKNGTFNQGMSQEVVDMREKNLSIATPDSNNNANTLSGDNQQRNVLAKWLACNPEVLILNGSKHDIHARVMLTLGKDGAVYVDEKQKVFQPIFKVKAVDTTAAGDTFTGYFLAGLSEGLPMEEVLRMSAKASSIAVTREGAVPSIPYRAEVMASLAAE